MLLKYSNSKVGERSIDFLRSDCWLEGGLSNQPTSVFRSCHFTEVRYIYIERSEVEDFQKLGFKISEQYF